MAQIQVLNRQPDPSAEFINRVASDTVNDIRGIKAIKAQMLQNKAAMRATENEEQKIRLDRRNKIFETAVKAKEMGLGGQQILKILTSVFGPEESFDAIKEMGSLEGIAQAVGGAPGTGKDLKDRSQAALLQSANRQLGGELIQPTQTGGQTTLSPIGGPTGDNVSISGSDRGAVLTGANIGGFNFSFPDALEQEAAARKRGALSVLDKPSEATKKEFTQAVESISFLHDNLLILANNFDELSGVLGPNLAMGPPAKRFLTNYYGDASAANAFLNQIKTGGQQFRVLITGAQAGLQEINMLVSMFPNEKMFPRQFMANTFLSMQTARNALRRQIPVLKAMGENVEPLSEALNIVDSMVNSAARTISPEDRRALELKWTERAQESGIPLAGQNHYTAETMSEAEKMMEVLPIGARVTIRTTGQIVEVTFDEENQ